METFDEYSDNAREIREEFEKALGDLEYFYLITFKSTHVDISRRLLNEIVEFKPIEEGGS